MAIAVLLAYGTTLVGMEAQGQTKPNIVFILTDDQDARTLRYMPRVQRELVEKGTTFKNGILSLPSCCPSRATMLRGQYSHNHKIGNGARPRAATFRKRGLEASTIATWLDGAGYRTGLVGKYLNEYSYRYVPKGWDQWYANVSSDVWAKCLNENGRERCYGGRHPDSVLADKAEEFIRSSKTEPFFLWLSFGAPHEYHNGPPLSAKTDRNKFRRVSLPKGPGFDEANVSDKPRWVRKLPRIGPRMESKMRDMHRGQLRSLQTVDRTVADLVDILRARHKLNDTYFFFFTDNGYHLGQHRLPPGKTTPYLEDTRFPLVVRGPGVSAGRTSKELIINTDLAPTFADLGSAQTPDFVDGRSFVPLLGQETPLWRTAALVENRGSNKPSRPAYSGVVTQIRTYVEYESGERELYNLETDPYQLRNAYPETDSALKEKLAVQLQALRSCEGQACQIAEDGSIP